jgi:hypothetical protein
MAAALAYEGFAAGEPFMAQKAQNSVAGDDPHRGRGRISTAAVDRTARGADARGAAWRRYSVEPGASPRIGSAPAADAADIPPASDLSRDETHA